MRNNKDEIPYPKGNLVAVDTETTGLDPHKGHRIFCWAWCSDQGDSGFLQRGKEEFIWLKKLMQDNTKTKIFHNAKFDLKMMNVETIDHWSAKIECTLILSHLYNSSISNSLRNMASVILGADLQEKDEVDNWVDKNKRRIKKETGRNCSFIDAPIELVKQRCLWDVENTLLLYKVLREKVDERVYRNELTLINEVIDMELNGITVDRGRAKELREKALRDIKLLEEKIKKIVGQEVNCRSGKQLTEVWHQLGIEITERTDKTEKGGGGNPCFNHKAIVGYVPDNIVWIVRQSREENWYAQKIVKELEESEVESKWRVPVYIAKVRELRKMVDTYYDNIIENSERDGKLHCNFNQTGAITGRFTCNGGMQTMPRRAGPRECFIASKGCKLWFFDYSQIEMRVFTHYAGDKQMQEAIEEDIHLTVASTIYRKEKKDITKEQRQRAKAINFGIIYGAGPRKIAETLTRDGIPTTVNEAMALVGAYHAAYPSVRGLMSRLSIAVRRGAESYAGKGWGTLKNHYGRVYNIHGNKCYVGLNYICQGSAADVIKFAIVRVMRKLWEIGSGANLLGQIHDELIFEIPNTKKERYTPKLIWRMMKDESFSIPIKVDVECGYRWSNKRKVRKVRIG